MNLNLKAFVFAVATSICHFVWRTLLVEVLAWSVTEIVADCWDCIVGLRQSIQVLAACRVPPPSQPALSVRVHANTVNAATASAPRAGCTDNEHRTPLVPSHVLSHPDVIAARAYIECHVGRWLPLSIASLLPNANPPLWPVANSTNSRKRPKHHINTNGASKFDRDEPRVTSCAQSSSLSSATTQPPLMPWQLHGVGGDAAAASRRKWHKVLVLDLDETLMHSCVTTAGMMLPPNFSEAIPTVGGAELYHIWERPYLRLFLRSMAHLYNLVVFTASAPSYADPILDIIDRHRVIKRRYYRSDCEQRRVMVRSEGGGLKEELHYVKDLNVLGVPLSNVVMLDNSPHCASLQPSNVIVVPPYYPPTTTDLQHSGGRARFKSKSPGGIDSDDTLLALMPLLEALHYAPDVRCVLEAVMNA